MKSSKGASKEKETKEKAVFNCTVERVHMFDEKHISFDMTANGIKISGLNYIEYTNKDGQDGVIINFPQRKGKENKYYNILWFPISKELKDDIIKQIEALV